MRQNSEECFPPAVLQQRAASLFVPAAERRPAKIGLEGQLRRNSIVCPTEFNGETSPSCCFLGVLPRSVQVPTGRGVTFIPQRQLKCIYVDTSDVNHINICFTGQ